MFKILVVFSLFFPSIHPDIGYYTSPKTYHTKAACLKDAPTFGKGMTQEISDMSKIDETHTSSQVWCVDIDGLQSAIQLVNDFRTMSGWGYLTDHLNTKGSE